MIPIYAEVLYGLDMLAPAGAAREMIVSRMPAGLRKVWNWRKIEVEAGIVFFQRTQAVRTERGTWVIYNDCVNYQPLEYYESN